MADALVLTVSGDDQPGVTAGLNAALGHLPVHIKQLEQIVLQGHLVLGVVLTAPDPATYIGSGKAAELRDLGTALDVDVVVFDDELSPAQQRNLEKIFAVDVVDRVALILDVGALVRHSRH